MGIRMQTLTVFTENGQGADGNRLWKTAVYQGYFGVSEGRDTSRSEQMPMEKLSGFVILKKAGEEWEKNENESSFLCGKSRICIGDFSAYGDPRSAQQAGAVLYVLAYAARPPHISDGTLVHWVEMQALRTKSMAENGSSVICV